MTSTLDDVAARSTVVKYWSGSVAGGGYPAELETLFPQSLMLRAQHEICSWPGYQASDVHSLHKLAVAAGVESVHFKDESTRFGLGSFKALGGAYAVISYLADALSEQQASDVSMQSIRDGTWKTQAAALIVASATDGNHGRSVAWGAQQAGCQCNIYIHRDVSAGREQAMQALGANVIRIDGDYDESVRECARESSSKGWQVISDTSYEGYTDVPRNVMAGYTTMVAELNEQLNEPPTHVFIQAGVGGLAASVCAAMWSLWQERIPKVVIVESEYSACVQQSLLQNAACNVPITAETIMAGLSCGEISLLAWEVLSRCSSAALSISDEAIGPAMQVMANSLASDVSIEAGECAVPGLVGLLAAKNNTVLAEKLSLNEQSRVLVFGCEGATDPVLYQRILRTDYAG